MGTRKAYTHHHQNKPLQRTKKKLWKRINQSMMAMSESAVPTSAPIYLTIPQNVNQQSDRDRIEKLFPKKTMSVCSILQLICAGLAALTQVVLFVVDPSRYSSIADVGAGIWTGVFFGFAGGVGLIASQRPSHCSVIAFMVMSIISSLFAIPLIVFSGVGLDWASNSNHGSELLLWPQALNKNSKLIFFRLFDGHFVWYPTFDCFDSRRCCSHYSCFLLSSGMLRKTVKQWYCGIFQCCTSI